MEHGLNPTIPAFPDPSTAGINPEVKNPEFAFGEQHIHSHVVLSLSLAQGK